MKSQIKKEYRKNTGKFQSRGSERRRADRRDGFKREGGNDRRSGGRNFSRSGNRDAGTRRGDGDEFDGSRRKFRNDGFGKTGFRRDRDRSGKGGGDSERRDSRRGGFKGGAKDDFGSARYGNDDKGERRDSRRGGFKRGSDRDFRRGSGRDFRRSSDSDFKRDSDRDFRNGSGKGVRKEDHFDKRQGRLSGGGSAGSDRNFKETIRKRVKKTAEDLSKERAGDEEIRLNKFISNSGVCSRREADEYITAGLVTVNGKIVTELGVKVSPQDDVRFNEERLKGEKKVYVLMNKPKDFVTTLSDPHAEKNVMQLISRDLCSERIFPVGRLDKSTTGVLLLTNDGELTEKLTHPSFQKKKIYQVTLDKNFKGYDMQKLIEGIELEDGIAFADEVSYVDDNKDVIGVEIHSGKNRIVRRMFEALGYRIKKLDRVYFAGLTKKNLSRGQWRFLSDEEVAKLKMNFYE